MNPSIFADAVTLPRALVAPDSFRPFEWAWLDESIPTGFARQVAAHPQVLAVQTADASLTYEQLGRMANRLAACLLDRLGHDAEPVAILASSDLNAVAAMLGVLAAGKFFVAINSASAQLEMQAILEDSGARAIVTDRDGAAAASLIAVEPPGLQVFHLDELDVDRDEPLPAVPMTGATYAQIAYTSGSTGRPKGILKTHRSLLHQSMTHINGYFITPADRMMAPAPLIFGASLGIVFSALLGGATLLPIRLKSQTAAQLRDWLRDEQVTVYHSVASFFRQFAATLDAAESFPHLRIIKLGGETIQPEDIRLYQERFADHCVLRVGLASTEAGNYCWHFIGKETPSEGPTVPVGRALVGTGISLLDEHREPVAPGMVGEIAVRSAFLASGYWRNPELTQARFLPDPADSQKQIYLTGDLGRWRDDGLLEHLGRADQMVKIRGNRVEIGAVEAALLALPAISAAAVMAAAGAGGAKRLVAYLTPAATERLPPVELRNHLQASLPDYMIPARYVWIEKMPLLPSGKIDRAALAPPSAARPDLPTPFIAPRSELEQQFVDIWAEVLELDAVGVNDNFFELGGDSILAMRMLLTVEKSLGGRVPTEFFGQPTVAHLARLMSGATATEAANRQPTTRRSSGSIVRQVGRFTPRNLARYLMQTGPFWRGHALPYGLGVRLQRALVAQPWFQQHFYARQLEIVRHWQAELGRPQDDQALIISLLANTWLEWRNRALTSPGVLESWVTMGGESGRLFEQPDPPCGIVMVLPHVGRIIAPLQRMIQLHGRETARVTNDRAMKRIADSTTWSAQQTQSRAAQLWQAQQVLRRNGVVFIAGDGRQGNQTVDVSFRGRRRPWQIGAAELAVTTGAMFVPAYIRVDATGRIDVEIAAPLIPQATTPQVQIWELTERYGTDYAVRWPRFYASMRWHHLAYNLSLPVV